MKQKFLIIFLILSWFNCLIYALDTSKKTEFRLPEELSPELLAAQGLLELSSCGREATLLFSPMTSLIAQDLGKRVFSKEQQEVFKQLLGRAHNINDEYFFRPPLSPEERDKLIELIKLLPKDAVVVK